MQDALIIAYALGYLWCYRFVVGYMLFSEDMGLVTPGDKAEAGDVAVSLLASALFTLFWPFLVAGRLLLRWFNTREPSLGFFRAPSPVESPTQQIHRLERERKARERRIAELERDLGMGRGA